MLPAKREFLRADIRYQEAKKRRSDEATNISQLVLLLAKGEQCGFW